MAKDNFNIEEYESVKQRKQKFYKSFPDGRVIVELLEYSDSSSTIIARIYKNRLDQIENIPMSTGHAQEFKGVGGFANKFSWLENCEESAVGRALDNAGFCGNGKCSREEMIKVIEKEKLEAKNQTEAYNSLMETIKNVTNEWQDKELMKSILDHLSIKKSDELKLMDASSLDEMNNSVISFVG